MKRIAIITLLVVGHLMIKVAASEWTLMGEAKTTSDTQIQSARYTLDLARLTQHKLASGLQINVPTPDGTLLSFQLTENNLLPISIKQRYPALRAYDGVSLDGSSQGKFTFSHGQFNAMFQYDGKWVYIDPHGMDEGYKVYFRQPRPRVFSDAIKQTYLYQQPTANASPRLSKGQTTDIRTFRLAVSATGEYTNFHEGKDNAVAEVAVAINRVNQIYNRDLGVNFTLIDNYDQLIFDDPDTDPFNNDVDDGELNIEVTNNAVGSDSYDIGHVFNTAPGGLAALASVCTSFKADGITGLSNPVNDAFYVDYVAHEIGHQMGANHSFNGTSGGCEGNRASAWAYEPGSGATIMSYAALCAGENIEDNFPDASTYDYFHISSVVQIRDTLESASCGTTSVSSNVPPVVDAGPDYTLPANTPFELRGIASDADGDSLQFSWEQYDLGTETASASDVSTDDGSRPIIRNYALSASPNRTVPKIDDLLSGTSTFGEILPATTRRLTFRFVARDGQGALSFDETQLLISDTGSAFSITSPNTGTFVANSISTVFWETAGTNMAPINCANVDILFSADGGYTFPLTLVAATENDGSEDIIWPDTATDKVRLKVACTNNLFFDVSDANLAVAIEAITAPVISGQRELTVDEDTAISIVKQDLTISAGDTDDLTLTVSDGDNYTVNNNTITPNNNFSGALSASVTATNSAGTSPPFLLLIDVRPVNDAPVINGVATNLSINNTQTLTLSLNNINYTDVDGDSVTLVVLAGENYSFNGLTITPNSGFTGTLNVNFEISDGELSDASSINIAVTAPPVPPTTPSSSGGGGSSPVSVLFILSIFALCRTRLEKVQ
ncbi:hypothetical protein DRW07_06800 [Alteromonas sediminis]|uniref:Peptidase M12B domain-containing protein n=1 Tax=Alteromonas sediminis TaxID=2259342 RepID=A0A3N5Y398_9ALTE|nr:zinc-dependent metalloprotease family protein [Alteromonas sediminis]RPJ67236.1 hypothetical protein DRW07_06800 [Alteromonas sediminis]